MSSEAALAVEPEFGDGDGTDDGPPPDVNMLEVFGRALGYVSARGPVFKAAVDAAMIRAMTQESEET